MKRHVLSLSAAVLRDLERLQDFLRESSDPLEADLLDFVTDALDVLTHQPGIGRPLRGGQRELIIGRGASGYLAQYRLDPVRNVVLVLRVRHQRESGYPPEQL
ncbi:MAG: type II toxin-antitoxin system RelE/ParE family toxin [Ottowia sp.]|uniref:type II toxin-antitoxin system RelE/ParE family toxin n=1 Tax=Ottowia sp. TaxID=1898956 RepID=UPI0039E6D2DC